jgi:hypothetical protein
MHSECILIPFRNESEYQCCPPLTSKQSRSPLVRTCCSYSTGMHQNGRHRRTRRSWSNTFLNSRLHQLCHIADFRNFLRACTAHIQVQVHHKLFDLHPHNCHPRLPVLQSSQLQESSIGSPKSHQFLTSTWYSNSVQ